MRASAQDRAAASLMGIDTGRVFALTWAVGVTCVGVAGVLLAPIYPVYPTVGLQFVLSHRARQRGAGRPQPRRPHRAETLSLVQRLFPVIAERQGQLAHTLSGGEQQMVAIARGLMARPRLLMIDEPFLGLAPMVVQAIGGLIRRVRDEQGISIVFIEQNVELALRLADRGYIMESGRTILSGPSAELLQSAAVKRIFLGDVAL